MGGWVVLIYSLALTDTSNVRRPPPSILYNGDECLTMPVSINSLKETGIIRHSSPLLMHEGECFRILVSVNCLKETSVLKQPSSLMINKVDFTYRRPLNRGDVLLCPPLLINKGPPKICFVAVLN